MSSNDTTDKNKDPYATMNGSHGLRNFSTSKSLAERLKVAETKLAAIEEFVTNEDGLCIQCLAVKTILEKQE